MTQRDPVRGALGAGRDATQKAQDNLESLVRDIQKATEDQANQLSSSIQDFVDRSRRNAERLVEVVDREVRAQLASVGVATKADIRRLENRIDALAGPEAKPANKPAAKGAKKAATKTTKASPAGAKVAKKPAKSSARKAPARG